MHFWTKKKIIVGLMIISFALAIFGIHKLVENVSEKFVPDETADWEIYQNEKLGFQFKISPLFKELGYEIIESKSSLQENIFSMGECNVIIFKTKPVETFSTVEGNEYKTMFIVQICPKEYCMLVQKSSKWKGADICETLRNGENETEKGDWMFSQYLAENERFFAYIEGGPSQGDFYDAMGWNKEYIEEARKQMLSTFEFIE